jgi:hypothetical protein
MIWKPKGPGLAPWTDAPIVPEEVLFAFDEPIVFSSRVGLSNTLFVKFAETDDHANYFYACPISDEYLQALKANELSLRGALLSGQAFVVEIGQDFRVARYWPEEIGEWSESLLPVRRVGLSAKAGPIWDSLDEARALLALTFRGVSLGRSEMPLGMLTALISKTHEAARRILVPPDLAGLKSASIDFQISPPKFSSLVLALKHPLFKRSVLDRRPEDNAIEGLTSEIESNSDEFVQNIAELSDSASNGEISLAVAQAKFSTLEQIKSIVPTERNKLTELAITSNTDERRSFVLVSHETGDKIVRARKLVEARPITDTGRIIQVNDKRSTVVYQSVRGKEVTFTMEANAFTEMEKAGLLKLGHRITATGYLHRRARRDSMDLTDAPRTSPRVQTF